MDGSPALLAAKWSRRLFLLALLGAVLTPFAAAAHNGAVAVAVPIEGIAIDGDLSDWPAGMRRYPILLAEVGNQVASPADFLGEFRIGYSQAENALYLAVKVWDESTVIDSVVRPTDWRDWNIEDGCEVYLDAGHGEEDRPVFEYVVYGNDRKGFEFVRTLPWQHVEVEVQREPGQHRYEWRIDIGGVSQGQTQLAPGVVLGFDVAVCDRDADGSFSWMGWGRGVNKDRYTERRGDVVLVGAEGQVGELRGEVRWSGVGQALTHAQIRIQSAVSQALWVQAETDREGRFAVELPAGEYWVGVSAGERIKVRERVAVRPGVAAVVHLKVPVSGGTPVQAGPGRTVRAGAGQRQGAWQTFGIPDGLLSFAVEALLQDRQGNLWIGTEHGGLSRYDGETFTTFTTADGLANNHVNCLLEDRQGNLWIGTEDGGLSRYGPSATGGEVWRSEPAALADLRFTTFTTADGLAGNQVTCLLEDRQGNLWIGTGHGGLSRYDGEVFTTFTTADGLAGNQVTCLLEDREGNLWIGTRYGGLSRYDGEGFTTYYTQEGLGAKGSNPGSTEVFALLEDRSGRLWVVLDAGEAWWRSGVYRFEGERFAQVALEGLPEADEVVVLLEDREGQLWAGTQQGRVGRWDRGRFAGTRPAWGPVRALLEDREGYLWAGAQYSGLSRYDGKVLTHFTPEDGLAHPVVLCMLEDRQGDLWFGTQGGVSRYDGKGFTTFTTKDGLTYPEVLSLLEDRQGNLWFGTQGRLNRYDGKSITTFPDKEVPMGNYAGAMLEDRKGRLWFAMWNSEYRGLYCYDGERFTAIYTVDDGLIGDRLHALLEDRQGNLWAGGAVYVALEQGGVNRYDGQRFTSFTAADGLAPSAVLSILEDRQGNLWFGSAEDGMSRYDGKGFTTLTSRDGLAHNGVLSMLEDRRGHLWFGTQGGGVSHYDGRVFQTLTAQDGLPDDVVYDLLEDRRGDLWMATRQGVARYRPRENPPPVLLTDVVADRRYGPVKELRLSTAQDYLSFEFRGVSLKIRPGQMVYLYRLQGYDADWRQTRERKVEYVDLPRGEYTFQVKAVDWDLNYSEVPAEVKVHVHLPYERIGWISLTFIGIGLFAWQTARIVRRDLKLQRVNQTLQQRTADLEQTNRQLRDTQTQLVQAEKMTTLGLLAGGVAHELNNPLQTLLAGSQRILRFPDDLERHRQSATLMERAAQHGSAIVQSLLNYTRRANDQVREVDLNEVVDSTLSLLQHQFEQGEIDLKVSRGALPLLQGNFAGLCTVVTNLVINARDAVLSASRDDGRQPSIRIATSAASGHVVLSVADNGPGIPPDLRERIFDPFFTTKEVGAGTGLGLSIVRGIVERHGGSIEVESAEGQGTTFTVHLPAGQSG